MKKTAPQMYIVALILVSSLFAGCSWLESKPAMEKQAGGEAAIAIASAESAIAKAKANDWIWRDTEKFLKQAVAAQGKGDDKMAVSMANKARSQAELAVSQYEYEKSKAQ